MKKIFALAFIETLFMICVCFAGDKNINNPGFFLNPQDVPMFYESNPLSEMKSFTLITSFFLKDTEMQGRIESSIEKSLGAAGEIVHLKENDMRGFGAGNIILIQIAKVKTWNGSETSLYRITLSVETPVTIDKTGIKTFPMIWTLNTFVEGSIESQLESNLTKGSQKLIDDFSKNYQYTNQSKTPIFYIYK